MSELYRGSAAMVGSRAVHCSADDFASKVAEVREARLRREAEEREAERCAEEAARKEYLAAVLKAADRMWNQADWSMERKTASAYDEIAASIRNLAAAYAQGNREEEFRARLARFHADWGNRPAMMRRLQGL